MLKKKENTTKIDNMSQFKAYIVNVKYTYSTKIYLFSLYQCTFTSDFSTSFLHRSFFQNERLLLSNTTITSFLLQFFLSCIFGKHPLVPLKFKFRWHHCQTLYHNLRLNSTFYFLRFPDYLTKPPENPVCLAGPNRKNESLAG